MKTKWKIGSLLLAATVLSVSLQPAAAVGESAFAARRDKLRLTLGGQAILFSGNEETTTGLDKNFYYLTGLAVPDSFLLMSGDSLADKLFLGPSAFGLVSGDEIVRTSGIVNVFRRDQIGLFLAAGLAYDPDVYFSIAYAPSDPAYVYPSCFVIERLLAGQPYFRRNSLSLAVLRMVKDANEIERIARASDITGRGLLAGMAALRPGMIESELQDVIEDGFRALGAPRTSFASIVGSGPNSLILHYQDNTRRMNAGEVVAVDVGAEYERYAGDITRTLPVSGIFTARQREVYEVVLECQRRVIEACRPGITLSALNSIATSYAAEKGYGDFVNFADWRHTTCHSLGLDVHDPFAGSAPLAPGMIITVEPGIYLPAENFGISIEDDVLITTGAPVILSAIVPRTPDGIEALMAGRVPAVMEGGRRSGKTPPVRRGAFPR